MNNNSLKMLLFLLMMAFGAPPAAATDNMPDGIVEVEKTGGDLPS